MEAWPSPKVNGLDAYLMVGFHHILGVLFCIQRFLNDAGPVTLSEWASIEDTQQWFS
jgi:hypothetical protein